MKEFSKKEKRGEICVDLEAAVIYHRFHDKEKWDFYGEVEKDDGKIINEYGGEFDPCMQVVEDIKAICEQERLKKHPFQKFIRRYSKK